MCGSNLAPWVVGAPQAAKSRDLGWEQAGVFVSPRFTHTDELPDRP